VTPSLFGCLGLSELYFVQKKKKKWPFKSCRSAGQSESASGFSSVTDFVCGPGSSVGIATDYGLDGPG